MWCLGNFSNAGSIFLKEVVSVIINLILCWGREHSEQWYHTSDLLVLCTTSCQLLNWFSYAQRNLYLTQSPLYRKTYIRLLVQSHLTSYNPTESNLYFGIYFATFMSGLTLYRFLTFHVPNLNHFPKWGRLSKESVKVWEPLWHFITNLFFRMSC
jgi:hypothetical protein